MRIKIIQPVRVFFCMWRIKYFLFSFLFSSATRFGLMIDQVFLFVFFIGGWSCSWNYIAYRLGLKSTPPTTSKRTTST